MSYHSLKLEHDHDLATITLNRPEKRNAISPEMIRELAVALHEAEASPARVLILTGAGRGFCAGMDLEVLQAMTSQRPEQILEDARGIAHLFRRIYSFPKPLIAAVNGSAIAGGCGIATLADFTLAASDAKFGYTEVRVGFMPAIVSLFVVRQLGEKRARDLLLTGRIFGAEEAHAMGLVKEIVPAERLSERARELATELAALSPVSLAYTKRLLARFTEAELDRDLELAVQASARIRATSDFREGITAFLEKRKPVWSGQ